MPSSIKGGTTPSKHVRHVTETEAHAVVEACPDGQWRALVGLAAYAGLRVPSETHGLRWADVDWEARRMRVLSPKTERFEGKGMRDVPIQAGFPEADLEIQVLCHRCQVRVGRASLVTDTYREIMGAAATSFETWARPNMDVSAVAST